MTDMTRIYVVEDDADIAALVAQQLNQAGYQVCCFRSARAFTDAVASEAPALCIIDLGLPDQDGLSLVRELRQTRNFGLIILSGRASQSDKILGLELGADDYIVKPFDPRELAARVNGLLRRLSQVATPISPPARTLASYACFDKWRYDTGALTLTDINTAAAETLSAGEADVLMTLLRNPRQILNRDQLLHGGSDAFDRSIDVRMSRLRRKLEADPRKPRLIKTVYGMGYMLTCSVEWRET